MKIKWFCLNNFGDMQYVGEFETFEEADESLQHDCLWLVPETEARRWRDDLNRMLRD